MSELMESSPTATQLLELVHDTAFSSLPVPAFGLATIDQSVPSHDSTTVTNTPETLPLPTATQLLAEVQETPLRRVSLLPTFGVLVTDQDEPFQYSANVLSVSELLT
jgi:hypothetical protein